MATTLGTKPTRQGLKLYAGNKAAQVRGPLSTVAVTVTLIVSMLVVTNSLILTPSASAAASSSCSSNARLSVPNVSHLDVRVLQTPQH